MNQSAHTWVIYIFSASANMMCSSIKCVSGSRLSTLCVYIYQSQCQTNKRECNKTIIIRWTNNGRRRGLYHILQIRPRIELMRIIYFGWPEAVWATNMNEKKTRQNSLAPHIVTDVAKKQFNVTLTHFPKCGLKILYWQSYEISISNIATVGSTLSAYTAGTSCQPANSKYICSHHSSLFAVFFFFMRDKTSFVLWPPKKPTFIQSAIPHLWWEAF